MKKRIIYLLLAIYHTESYKLFNVNRQDRSCTLKSSVVEDLELSSRDENFILNPFLALARNPEFIQKYWQRNPFYCGTSLHNIADKYTMIDVQSAVSSNFLEAGRGTFQEMKTGWQMAQVSQPRGKSYEEAKLRFEDVEKALTQKSGTVVFNSAGGFIPRLAGVCADACFAFNMPVALNMYLTNPGQVTSAPLHTDKQDVFVLQTQGQKHWRVYAPPSLKLNSDPFARGKDSDIFLRDEVGEPIIDTVLSPGQILYVPGGFPHTTDTVVGTTDLTNPSVHLTVGVDTHIWGLSYASLRRYVLSKAGLKDDLVINNLPSKVYWLLQDTLPLGFLLGHRFDDEENIDQYQSKYIVGATRGLIQRMRAAEPYRWESASDIRSDPLFPLIRDSGVIEKLFVHHRMMTSLFLAMYEDVRDELSAVKMNLSFFRSLPYFQEMEKLMEELEQWAKPANTVKVAAGEEHPINTVKTKLSKGPSKGFGK